MAAAASSAQDAQALIAAAAAAHGAGDGALAEQMLRRALATGDRLPQAHHHLATLLKEKGALEEALRHCDQAVRVSPAFFEALIQRGEILVLLGHLAEAEAPLRKAYRLRPDSVTATVALAFLCGRLGKAGEAERLLRAGLKKQPENAYYRNNLGQLLVHRGRHQEALALLQPLSRTGAASSELFVNIGNALVGVGRLEDAVDSYLQAVRLNPLSYFGHDNANNLLWQLGRKDEIGKSFVLAKQALPHHPDLLEMSAASLISFSRLDEAEADLAEASRLRPGTMGQCQLWTMLRLAQRRPLAAIAAARAGLALQPDEPDLLRKLAEAGLMADRPQDALVAAQRLARIDPFNQFAAAYEANAWRLLGEPERARRLYDYERFVHAVDLAAPRGYSSLEDFHRVLSQRLDQLHQARHEPVNQTLRHGTQTFEDLFSRPDIDPAIAQLGASVLAAAKRFIASLPDDRSHPFVARKGSPLEWAGSWSVRLGGGGFHTDHIHAEGWISGAYYIETPDCVADRENKPGWIKFGEFSQAVGPSLPWEKAVQPRPGLLVLFPSYMWHGTLPVSGSQPRLTVAFDIKPVLCQTTDKFKE